MKICVIVPSFYPAVHYGGTIFSIHESLKKISSENFKIYVSTTSANGHDRLNVKKNTYIKFNNNYYVKYYFDEIINRFSFSFLFGVWSDVKKSDLLYLQDVFSFFAVVGLMAAKFYNKKCIIAPRGSISIFSLKNKFYYLKTIWINLFFKILAVNLFWHATSKLEKKDIMQLKLKGKIFIIPNFLSINHSIIDNLNKLVWEKSSDRNKFKIGVLTRIDKKKGLMNLLHAFNSISKKYPMILSICGNDHGYLELLKNEVDKLDLKKSVYFLDPIYGLKKFRYLKSLNLFCLPSDHENFGNVYLESLLAGTPVIAGKNTPWASLQRYGCGISVENKTKSIVDGIIKIYSNKKKYNKKNCQKLASTFDIKKMPKLYFQMFAEAVR
jgi:glycosyltransferase involved in cell wall biosynthesis